MRVPITATLMECCRNENGDVLSVASIIKLFSPFSDRAIRWEISQRDDAVAAKGDIGDTRFFAAAIVERAAFDEHVEHLRRRLCAPGQKGKRRGQKKRRGYLRKSSA